MDDDHFDAWVAEHYEVLWPELYEPAVLDPVVDFLARLAGGGPVLELGVGTGRVARPLAERGLSVHGIERSRPMVARLRELDAVGAVGVTVGDFAATRVNGEFTLAYLVRNTIMNVATQDAQIECFRNVAAHLSPSGTFVIEVVVPELQRLPPGERFRVFTATPAHLGVDEIDVADQRVISHHTWHVEGQVVTRSAPFRYVWPSELDLMARLAGLRLRERWADWHRRPFTNDSRSHVSVWEKVGDVTPGA